MSPLLRTLIDIGPRRLQRRLRYTLRQRLNRSLPPYLALALAGAGSEPHPPSWRSVFETLAAPELPLPPGALPCSPEGLRFTFLNQLRQLAWPIPWNDPAWERLWQFHLHYFDWARIWLDQALSTGQWPAEAQALEPLLDHWIAANVPGRGDGWHSYTLSLRSRNWIWLFRCCPDLATPTRLASLWQQLRWLQAHPEHCHGGNHWLENLTALAVGSLQFEGVPARRMHDRALRLLRRELADQVLADGGHEERSASYHLLMLDRLVELACTLVSLSGERPAWLLQAIAAMSGWARAVCIEGGQAPRFNDSAADTSPPLDVVLAFAEAFLQGRSALAEGSPSSRGLRQRLLESASARPLHAQALPATTQPAPRVTDLPATGWTILRPGHGWELAFRSGIPCPAHLPSHTHSDQLSLELSHRGRWLLSEAGTSVYACGLERAYERSGAAHNVLQLGRCSPDGTIHWIEPVQVWGAFRAGRKAQPRRRGCGTLPGGGCFVEGSHDGFDHYGADHHRRVELSGVAADRLTLTLHDTVTITVPVLFRIWWHLAPELPRDLLQPLRVEARTACHLSTSWHDTWFAHGFGQRSLRQSYCLSGSLPTGQHHLSSVLPLNLAPPAASQLCPASG